MRKKKKTGTIEESIKVAGVCLPRKVYPLRAYKKSLFLFPMLLVLPFLAVFVVASLIPDELELWARVLFVAWVALSMVALGWVFFRGWTQRLEFSDDGVTLYYGFYRIYTPWTNIAGYDQNALYPYGRRSYGSFVYKEPASLYIPLKKGKKEHCTVVQIPRLRARTNPELVAYLSHYLPLFREMFPEKELPLLTLLEITDK
ncbi:MAG: hypothetical protein WCD86_18125 [Ktedonobacteraceae bacterium]|nr:hypothetical protein [Ktedonobacteraceae bacterium]